MLIYLKLPKSSRRVSCLFSNRTPPPSVHLNTAFPHPSLLLPTAERRAPVLPGGCSPEWGASFEMQERSSLGWGQDADGSLGWRGEQVTVLLVSPCPLPSALRPLPSALRVLTLGRRVRALPRKGGALGSALARSMHLCALMMCQGTGVTCN